MMEEIGKILLVWMFYTIILAAMLSFIWFGFIGWFAMRCCVAAGFCLTIRWYENMP